MHCYFQRARSFERNLVLKILPFSSNHQAVRAAIASIYFHPRPILYTKQVEQSGSTKSNPSLHEQFLSPWPTTGHCPGTVMEALDALAWLSKGLQTRAFGTVSLTACPTRYAIHVQTVDAQECKHTLGVSLSSVGSIIFLPPLMQAHHGRQIYAYICIHMHA